ncbi:MAG TPA: TIGR01244 family sulfur transferase [Marinobacter sp.]|nr:TIGR01244 family sulfur transferase [Marinobacter sp.]
MQIRKIDETISVAPQITADEVAEIARLGFRTLVANRPDGEEFGQPAMSELEAAAEEHGLQWVYLPVQSGHITDEDVARFAPMMQAAEKPILAFCRSGTRCTVLWALSAVREQEPQAVLSRAHNAGYDITGLLPRLLQHAGQK